MSYDVASRLTTSISGTAVTTYTYDTNGNMTNVNAAGTRTTMSYIKENRMSLHQSGVTSTTMVYDAMGLKSKEIAGSVTNQFVWDGDNYLGERNSTAGVGTSQISKLYHSVGNLKLCANDLGSVRKEQR